MEFLTVPQMPKIRDLTAEEHKRAQDIAVAFFDTGLHNGNADHEVIHQWYLDQTGGDEELAKYAATMMIMSVLCLDYGMTLEEAMEAVGVKFIEESYQKGE